jgi:hypothetical protein
MVAKVQGSESNVAFYYELLEIYRANKRRINKKVFISGESNILDFCSNEKNIYWGSNSLGGNLEPFREIKYENLCKLAFIFSNILGRPMPEFIQNRMILGPNNQWVKEYFLYIKKLKPYRFFNPNPNFFRSHRLSNNGHLIMMQLK